MSASSRTYSLVARSFAFCSTSAYSNGLGAGGESGAISTAGDSGGGATFPGDAKADAFHASRTATIKTEFSMILKRLTSKKPGILGIRGT